MSNRVSQMFGAYRLVRLLGQGGFAEVYLGQHIHLNSLAAIKILVSTKINQQAEWESFRSEAQIIAALNHPNIVRVLDFNIEQGAPFFAMEYASRGSLRTLYPRGSQVPLSALLPYVRQIASALQYAHGNRQIHRDVKPENILVRDDGSIMLSDFGIAVVAHSSRSQNTQEIIGTVAYMAPEQLEGRPRLASDQYTLALLVYEWLCGELPFRGSFTEIATQQLLASPPSLREKMPEIPAAVEAVVIKALAKDPKQRYSTVSEFATALEQASQVAGEIISTGANSSALLVRSGGFSVHEANAPTVEIDRPTLTAEPLALQPQAQRTRFWRLGRREVLTMTIGVLLYTLLSNLLFVLSSPLPGARDLFWIAPALVLPLFFGIAYGPWVGLVTSGPGYFLGTHTPLALHWPMQMNVHNVIYTARLDILPSTWYFYLAFSMLGFLAGLAPVLTKERTHFFYALMTAEAWSLCAILAAFVLGFNSFWSRLYAYETFWLDFTHIALPNIVLVLILLPMILTGRSFLGDAGRRLSQARSAAVKQHTPS